MKVVIQLVCSGLGVCPSLLQPHPPHSFPQPNQWICECGVGIRPVISENAQGKIQTSVVEYIFPLSYRSTQSGAYDYRTDRWISQDAGGWYQANAELNK